MTKRTCLCGEILEANEEYGPCSQLVYKWYQHGRSFGEPARRRKFYLCDAHTREIQSYLEAVASGQPVAVVLDTSWSEE